MDRKATIPLGDAQARAIFSGTVQGVGFRYTAARAASRFRVAGYVRNLSDGTVELVAEGARDEVQALLDAIREQMSEYVTDCQTTWGPAAGQYTGFRIGY